jgi:hypothetical protein
METWMAVISLVVGVTIRIGIPVLVTALLVTVFTRLDARWKEDADRSQAVAMAVAQVANTGCWNVHNCPAEKRATCAAFKQLETPCWQVFRSKSGQLQERCLGCDVFKDAPVPA